MGPAQGLVKPDVFLLNPGTVECVVKLGSRELAVLVGIGGIKMFGNIFETGSFCAAQLPVMVAVDHAECALHIAGGIFRGSRRDG